MKDRAYAKINLALDVFDVREDGYHDLKSIMIPLDFYDELEINIANTDSYDCNKKYLAFDKKNSIVKMIDLFKEKFNINDHYFVKLDKQIPTQAGLGGGTSDGASTLRILQKIYNISLSDEQIKDLCMAVGADVLFNYYNTPCVVSGVGDVVKPFKMKDQYHVLLVKPRFGISTKQAYELLDMNICDHPNIDKIKCALENGEDINGLLGNSLEQPAFILNSEIKKLKDELYQCGASNVLMSGSGSTVYAISKNKKEIMNLYDKFINKNYFVRFCKTSNE